MKKITVSAPGKLMLFGEHAVVYGRPCLVTAVNQRIRLTIEEIDSQDFLLDAPDVGIASYKKPLRKIGIGDMPKGVKFVEVAIKSVLSAVKKEMSHGIHITTSSEFSSQFGFGSSSAASVCAVVAMAELLNVNLSQKEIFDIAYQTVLDIQGKGSGYDVAAAVYGGTLYFVIGGEKIESLTISDIPLVVGYSGVKADTVTLINAAKERFKNTPEVLEKMYTEIGELVTEAKDALLKKDFPLLGILMNKNQLYLQQLGVSIPKLDAMIEAANSVDAYGAKLSGAGGGDCMIALVSEENKQAVEKAIEKVGGEILSVKTNAKGVAIEA